MSEPRTAPTSASPQARRYGSVEDHRKSPVSIIETPRTVPRIVGAISAASGSPCAHTTGGDGDHLSAPGIRITRTVARPQTGGTTMRRTPATTSVTGTLRTLPSRNSPYSAKPGHHQSVSQDESALSGWVGLAVFVVAPTGGVALLVEGAVVECAGGDGGVAAGGCVGLSYGVVAPAPDGTTGADIISTGNRLSPFAASEQPHRIGRCSPQNHPPPTRVRSRDALHHVQRGETGFGSNLSSTAIWPG